MVEPCFLVVGLIVIILMLIAYIAGCAAGASASRLNIYTLTTRTRGGCAARRTRRAWSPV